MEVGRQHVERLAAGQRPEQSESHRMVPPVRLGERRLEERLQLRGAPLPRCPKSQQLLPHLATGGADRGGQDGNIGQQVQRLQIGRSSRQGSATAGSDEYALKWSKRGPKPSQGPALEALGVANQPPGDCPLQAPRMGVAADR